MIKKLAVLSIIGFIGVLELQIFAIEPALSLPLRKAKTQSDATKQSTAEIKGSDASKPSNAESKSETSQNTPKAAKGGDETMGIKIGLNDAAPDVALPDQHGKIISLKDFHGNKVVVLYFYPKDNTRVCTAEACTFRDSYDAFKDLGAEVIGISSDSVESHKKFAEKNRLQFPLLADTSGMVRKAFGVPNTAAIVPGRVTYVIDKSGKVRYLFNSMLDGPKHVTEAMKIVKDLAAEPAS